MEETLEQKIARISKFGIRDVEVFTEDEASSILLAHTKYLNDKIDKMTDSLEKIATGMISTGEAQALAAEALEKISLREWRTKQ